MLKKRIIPLLLLAVALLLAGCAMDLSYPDYERGRFYANLKADAWSGYGKKAAYYDGRVYYPAAELGTYGVYSMAEDGGDVRLEFACGDVRSLQVGPEGFLFCGFRESVQYSQPHRWYRLYALQPGETQPVDVLDQFREAEQYQYADILSGYRTQSGEILLGSIEGHSHMGYWAEYNLLTDGAMRIVSECTPLAHEDAGYAGKRNVGDLNLFTCGPLCFSSAADLDPEGRVEIGWTQIIGVYDMSAHAYRMKTENSTAYRKSGDSTQAYGRWICDMADGKALLVSKADLSEYDWERGENRQIVSFPLGEAICDAYDCGDSVLLLTTQRDPFHAIAFSLSIYRRVLYRIDRQTGARERLFRIPFKEVFLYLDENRAAVTQGNCVEIYDLRGETPALLKTLPMQEPIVRYGYKTDVAGEWLFVYAFNGTAARNELVQKLYIG